MVAGGLEPDNGDEGRFPSLMRTSPDTQRNSANAERVVFAFC
jgi:hypothetical protein